MKMIIMKTAGINRKEKRVLENKQYKKRVKHYLLLCAMSKKLDSVHAYQKLSLCAVRPSARVDLANEPHPWSAKQS